MEIVLLGFDFSCPNKGCEALSYTVVAMIRKLFPQDKITIHNVTYKDTLGVFPEIYSDVYFVQHNICLKSFQYMREMFKLMKKADAVLDVTFGDSFSDIYGKKWLTKTNLNKQLAVWANANLILMPQTYGPYKNLHLKRWSLNIIKKSQYVFSRDQKSADYLMQNKVEKVDVVTDLAMSLPYDKEKYTVDSDKINVGLNVSSLLWEGGFTGKNEFGLTVDYQKYCKTVIESLLKEQKYRIHLIPHVIEDTPEARENDYRPLRELHNQYPETEILPMVQTPIDIKSYISNMDVFIGARMHATIGAFSSDVPVIPFAYSRKFAGLFETLNYQYVVDGCSLSTEEAIKMTLAYIEKREALSEDLRDSLKAVQKKTDALECKLKKLIEKKQKV